MTIFILRARPRRSSTATAAAAAGSIVIPALPATAPTQCWRLYSEAGGAESAPSTPACGAALAVDAITVPPELLELGKAAPLSICIHDPIAGGDCSSPRDQVTYAWVVVAKPAGSSANLAASGASAVLSPDVAGAYEAAVTLEDDAYAVGRKLRDVVNADARVHVRAVRRDMRGHVPQERCERIFTELQQFRGQTR